MSKIIKASQIIGKYKLSNEPQKDTDKGQKQKEENKKEQAKKEQATKEKQKEKAEKIIKEAEEKADEIIKEAEAEKARVEEIKEKAYNEGFEQGKKEGYQETTQKLQSVINSLSKEIESLDKRYEEEINKIQPFLIDIATKMAGKIINQKINESPEIINNIVEDVMGDLSNNHQQFVIKVNPEILPYLNRSELKTSFPESEFELNADDSLQKGDCVINTNFGGKDAYLVEKLERLQKQIKKEMGMN